MEIADALRLRFPGDPDVMRLAGTATKSVGDIHVKLKDLDAALDAYGRANEIFKERAASLPGDAQAQRDWTTSLIASGYALDRQGLTERALELFRVAEEIRLDARDRAPNARTRRDLLNARYRIGWAHYKLDEPERALAVFEDLLVEARALRAADPDDRRADDDLEKVLAGLADFAEASGSDHRAVEALLEQRALLEEVVEANPTDLDTHKAIQRLDERIAALEADEVP
ncbi:MAG: tetratricopeptide repeat protein [bacterium]|nr:tetratricopeptide repeat protein [bacterium]